MVSLLRLCLVRMHCFRREHVFLGIKGKLWQWELSDWEWPCRRGCEREAGSFLGFPIVSQVVAVLPEPTVPGAWCQRKCEFPQTLPQNLYEDCSQSIFWIISSRHIVSSAAGCVSGHCGHRFQPSSLLSSTVWLHRSLNCGWVEWFVLTRSLHDYPEKRRERSDGVTFAQYVIKTVTLCHHSTRVLILAAGYVPASVTTISEADFSHSSRCTPRGEIKTLSLLFYVWTALYPLNSTTDDWKSIDWNSLNYQIG